MTTTKTDDKAPAGTGAAAATAAQNAGAAALGETTNAGAAKLLTLDDLSPEAIQGLRNELAAQAARDASARQADKGTTDDPKITAIDSVDVLIFRNENASIPDTVFRHELPILQALHGVDMVKVVREDTLDVEDFDPTEELERLQRKYVSKDGDPVGRVFRNDPREVAREAGVQFRAGTTRKPKTSEQTPAKKAVLQKQK